MVFPKSETFFCTRIVNCPVENVLCDSVVFANALSERWIQSCVPLARRLCFVLGESRMQRFVQSCPCQLNANGLALPTEAEWELAAKGLSATALLAAMTWMMLAGMPETRQANPSRC